VTVLDDRVEQEVTIAAPRELVWEFFTEADRLVQWKGSRAELDPRPGGVYRCVIDGQSVALGEYLTVSPYDEVSFSWGWEGDPVMPPGSSTVTVTLTEVPEGTHLRLTHTGLPHPRLHLHDAGWTRFLPELLRAAEARPT
jgi:uncharacterized protein YndB with AHSA1/START domain